MYKFASTKILV